MLVVVGNKTLRVGDDERQANPIPRPRKGAPGPGIREGEHKRHDTPDKASAGNDMNSIKVVSQQAANW